ncbi:MAG: FAD-binding protein [Novosphingobium sp.]|jgi:4-cresol dehydrogenase (hydroxylating)|uniref:FAD-binding protein n=1 Tax=Novosphingobium sp. TaxID=1874826 RepID=UPI003019742F
MTDLKPLIARLAAVGTQVSGIESPRDLAALKAVLARIRGSGANHVVAVDAFGTGLVLPASPSPAVLIDLTGMARINDLDGDYALALVEPGVTFRQLGAEIARRQLPLSIDATIHPDISVAAATLSRQFGYTPYGDRVLMQCGAEVVLPGGDVVRLGMGAVPNSRTWQMFKHNFGPYLDGLFTQSDLGLVTQLGLWLAPSAPQLSPLRVEIDSIAVADQLIGALRPLRIANVIAHTIAFTTAAFDRASFGARGSDKLQLTTALVGLPKVLAVYAPLIAQIIAGTPGARAIPDDNAPEWLARKSLLAGQALPDALPPVPFIDFAGAASSGVMARAATAFGGVAAEYLLTGRTLLVRVLAPADGPALVAAAVSAGFGIASQSLEFEKLARAAGAKSALAQVHTRLRGALHA